MGKKREKTVESLGQLPLYLTLCATQVNGMGCEGASVYDWYVLVCDGKSSPKTPAGNGFQEHWVRLLALLL